MGTIRPARRGINQADGSALDPNGQGLRARAFVARTVRTVEVCLEDEGAR